jgi:hypothetical protein
MAARCDIEELVHLDRGEFSKQILMKAESWIEQK